MSLFTYTSYTCSVSSGSTLIQTRVTGFGPERMFLFSLSNTVGDTIHNNGFFGTLTSRTNGLTSIVTFNVTSDMDGTRIFCEDPDDSDMKFLDVEVRGK